MLQLSEYNFELICYCEDNCQQVQHKVIAMLSPNSELLIYKQDQGNYDSVITAQCNFAQQH